MKNLGKIILLCVSLATTVFADVKASVMPDIVYAGDTARYSLTLSGENIKKPIVTDICGNDVVSSASQTSIVMINGDYKKTYTLSYTFVAQKSCKIEPIAVEIDSKIEYSNAIDLKVKPMTQDLSADFVLSLESSKKELYVGEAFNVTFILKQKRGAEVVDSKFVAPNFKGFWLKAQSKPITMNDGVYMITKLSYRLAPQREGNLSIKPAQIKIATRVRRAGSWGGFMQQVRWKTYYSNELNIQVKALPQGVKLIGDFSISAEPQKLEINANEALNLTIKVLGKGNFEDIESFKPYMSNVNIFDEKINIARHVLTQKLVFVSDTNFTIPSFTLKYFDIKTKKIETISTKEIAITVNPTQVKRELEVQREKNELPDVLKHKDEKVVKILDKSWIFLAFVLGLSMGIVLMLVKPYIGIKKSKKFNIKDEKLLLMKLLAFKENDAEVQKIVDILENNLYSKAKEPIDKKILKEIIKRYDIS